MFSAPRLPGGELITFAADLDADSAWSVDKFPLRSPGRGTRCSICLLGLVPGSSATHSAWGPFGSADAGLQNRPSVLPPYDQKGTHHPHKQTPRWAKGDGSRR